MTAEQNGHLSGICVPVNRPIYENTFEFVKLRIENTVDSFPDHCRRSQLDYHQLPFRNGNVCMRT